MKPTKKATLDYVRSQLSISKVWATKALIRIYKENQTPSEQNAQTTTEDNGIGFTGVDAPFLSSLAAQYEQKGFLSEKQMGFVLRKMPKYARQVVQMSDPVKLKSMVEAVVA